MSAKSEIEMTGDCHGVTEVSLMTAWEFYGMVSSIESLERLECAHELVTSLENEMNLKDSEADDKATVKIQDTSSQ